MVEARQQTRIAQEQEAEATKQTGIAQANEAEAFRQKGLAEQAAALAVANERTKSLPDAYGDFVFGLQNKIENRPGTLELQKELSEVARVGLRKILDDVRKLGNADFTVSGASSDSVMWNWPWEHGGGEGRIRRWPRTGAATGRHRAEERPGPNGSRHQLLEARAVGERPQEQRRRHQVVREGAGRLAPSSRKEVAEWRIQGCGGDCGP